MEDLILDGYDNITRGLVNYALYDDSCNVMQAFIQKINLGENYNLSTGNLESEDFSMQQVGDDLIIFSTKGTTIKLFDLMGKMIEKVSFDSGMAKIDVSGLNSGIYILSSNENSAQKWYKK